MASRLPSVIVAALSICTYAQAQLASKEGGLSRCLIAAGLSSLAGEGTQPWEGHVTLTVSDIRDAARIEFDKFAVKHGKLLVFGVLPLLKFDSRCRNQRFSFVVRWEPTTDGRYGVAVRDNTLIVTGKSFTSPAHRYGGPLQLDSDDFQQLKRIDSLREFLTQRRFDPGY
jgi:hypothetical protein